MDDEWSPGRDLTRCPAQHIRHRVSAPKSLTGQPFGQHVVDYHRWNYVSKIYYKTDGPLHHPPEAGGTCDGPQLVRRVIGGVTTGAYHAVALSAGSWDATWGRSAARFEQGLDEAIQALRTAWPNATLLLLTQTPEGHELVHGDLGAWTRPARQRRVNDVVIELNRRIRRVAQRTGAHVLDAWQMAMSRPDLRTEALWEGRARRFSQNHWPSGDSWHFTEATTPAELRAARNASYPKGHPRGELSRAIALRILNVLCPER